MRKLLLFLASLLATAGITHSETEPSDPIPGTINQLQKIGQDFAQAAQLSGSLGVGGTSKELKELADEYRDYSNSFASLNSYVQNGNYEEAVATIRRWMRRTHNKQVQQSLTTLLEALQAQRKKKVEEITKAIDEAIAKASSSLRKATTPDQVETIRVDLEDLRADLLGSGGRDLQRLSNRIQRAVSLLENWRQLLCAENDGDLQQALSYLNQIRQNHSTEGLISQKEISDRYSALFEKQLKQNPEQESDSPILGAAAEIMGNVKSGKDAQEAAIKMARLLRLVQERGYGNITYIPTINALTQRLNYIDLLQSRLDEKAFQQVVETTYNEAIYTYPRGGRSQPLKLDEARMSLIINDQKITAIEALYPNANLGKPNAGETLPVFLNAKAQEAYESKNWPVLYQRLQALTSVGGGNLQQGIRSYISGGQLEKAGLYREAIRQYAACIEQTGPFVPREEAAAAVVQILKEHPEAQSASRE
ncbi:MAG: hypothetical protein WAN16_10570 [Chthoniobacterales bacterium]